MPEPFRSDCCNPIAAPLRRWPASSTAAANERLFQLIASTPAATSEGRSTASGAPTSAAVSGEEQPRSRVRSSATGRGGCRRRRTTGRRRCEPRRRAPGRRRAPPPAAPGESPRLSCRKRTANPSDADLRRNHERAADRDPPEAPVAERRGARLVAGRSGVRSRSSNPPTHGSDQAGSAERCEAEADAAVHGRAGGARARRRSR